MTWRARAGRWAQPWQHWRNPNPEDSPRITEAELRLAALQARLRLLDAQINTGAPGGKGVAADEWRVGGIPDDHR